MRVVIVVAQGVLKDMTRLKTLTYDELREVFESATALTEEKNTQDPLLVVALLDLLDAIIFEQTLRLAKGRPKIADILWKHIQRPDDTQGPARIIQFPGLEGGDNNGQFDQA